MHYEPNEAFLMHYGVKGMKWGVRRYQNEDGTLTAKGKKKLAKNEAYRTKLANKANKKAEKRKAEAKQAVSNIKDLKAHGAKSETYKKYIREREEARELEYERKNRVTVDGETYVKKYKNLRNSFRRFCYG